MIAEVYCGICGKFMYEDNYPDKGRCDEIIAEESICRNCIVDEEEY